MSGAAGSGPGPVGLLFSKFNLSFWINRGPTQQFFDAKQLVVFGHPVGAGSTSRFDLTAVQSHGQVCDRSVFCFAASMAHDRIIAVVLGQRNGIDRFSQQLMGE